jgi:hypothetical protein
MRDLIIPGASILLRLLLLLRAIRCRLVWKYPFFYAFIAGALAVDSLLIYVYARVPNIYLSCYWAGEFLTLALACGIVLEIFRHVLSAYPGVERFARNTGIFAFGVILCAGLYRLLTRLGTVGRTMADLETSVRVVQAIFLLTVLALISYYGIQIGRNMRGMMLGYGFSIASTLLNLSAYSYAGRFADGFLIFRQVGYAISIAIWTVTLWSYAPNPVDAPAVRIEMDYEQLADRTRAAMGTLRGYLGWAVRP